jgi:hypothetical protein
VAERDDEELNEAELTAEDVLTFGPVVEAAVWTPIWLQEARAPIAQAAGRPKFGPIFNSDGIGKAVVIRPCISRGRRIRGLAPIYTPQMLEANAGVFNGWPMFMDHVPPELAEKMAKYGRSVKELGGQVVKGWWGRDFVHEDDAQYGYQKGAVLAEIWATPFIRQTVGENANLLHTSINAWPKSGKPGPVPWRSGMKGMVIEGIRRQPQGSLDFVVRGGAGGRLLVQEGMEDEGAWPDPAAGWAQEDVALVVSVAESLYGSPQMSDLTLPKDPKELRKWLQENDGGHLLPALTESDNGAGNGNGSGAPAAGGTPLTEADVQQMIERASAGAPTVEEFEQRLEERAAEMLQERDEQRHLASIARDLIVEAEGLPDSWKRDLIARYSMLPSGPSAALIVEAETDDAGKVTKAAEDVLKESVKADLDHSRNLMADAKGKPRVTGEGGKDAEKGDGESKSSKAQEGEVPHWRERFAGMGLAESADDALTIYGGKPKKKDED